MKLSILIPSLADRTREFATPLQQKLSGQIQNVTGANEVEVLVLTDYRRQTTGAKRNRLLSAAIGDYVAFIDDDDDVAPEYIESILWAIDKHSPDVVTFNFLYDDNGKNPTLCRYGKDYECYTRDEQGVYLFKPSPQHAWRREIAQSVGYPDANWKEDDYFRKHAAPLIQTEANIDRVLYYYHYRGNK